MLHPMPSVRTVRRKLDRLASPRRFKIWRPTLELLEARVLLVSDFGDAPLPYATLLAQTGAEHVAVGPSLGTNRDTEANGVHSAGADGDDTTGSPDDEDGVTFGTIQVGQVGATLTVNVAGGSAKLDAWVDFNGDGAWGGPLEQIADRVAVVPGNNTITFDVPSWAADGTTYARFRLSTAGNLGVGGAAVNGEVEDYAVTIAPPVAASGNFGGQKTISAAANGAQSVRAADVDGDGDTDVLSASFYDNKIAWFENNGSQSFTTHIISNVASGANSVFAADVDGDGDTDVLSTSGYDDKIAWYKNDGNQNFTAHTISSAADAPYSVFAADVDGDGDTDVLSASLYDDKIAWYKNDGNQNFTAHTISTAANGAISVFAADVDGDGDTDVFSASFLDDKIAWYENNGSQNFTTHTISTAADVAFSVFAADVDTDGDLDVLSASVGDDKIAWYENDGSQNFTTQIITTLADGARSVFAADLDGDGNLDVLSASANDDKVAWYKNDGSQNFTTQIITTAADGARSVSAGDVDGDGDLDVLSASFFDDKIGWYENANLPHDFGDAPLPYPTLLAEDGAEHIPIGPTLGTNRDTEVDGVHSTSADGDDNTGGPDDEDGVTFGTIRAGQVGATLTVNVAGGSAKLDAWIDFNGDGAWGGPLEQIADRVALVTGNNTITFDVPSWAADGTTYARFRLSTAGNLGVAGTAADGEVEDYAVTIDSPKATAGKFGSQKTISTAEGRAESVFAADVDGDGDTDVVSGSRNDNKIAWHENDGSQNFTSHTIATGGTFVLIDRYVFAADVDGDGDTDILSADQVGVIVWYENDGGQNFTAHIIATAGLINTRSVFAADMDGDGDIDVFTAAANDDSIYWYENDGNENFLPYLIDEQADEAASVFAADVDSDGDMDVLSASTNDDKIAWYKNDGSQNFATQIISTAVDRPLSVFAADVDGDGDTDVLASFSAYATAVAWYENDGNQNFALHLIPSSGLLTRSVFAADMDGDGDTDVLSVSFSHDQIAWYKNDGSQNFTAQTISTAADGPRSVFAADVDGDGDLDVLSASYNDNKIAWYENVEVDFGDAPLPYPTLWAGNGAEHTAVGPILGVNRDAEANGVHSAGAAGDDNAGSPDDEDGVTFGTIQVGQVGATLTVNVAGGSAKLDAWIDFNGDGAWGGPLEQIADRVAVVTGGNTITFDVPSWAADGTTYARFRLSTAGNLGVGGTAADGEVEDYAVTIAPPKAAAAKFSSQKTITAAAVGAHSVFAADVDGDGDTDLLSASGTDDKIAWYEIDGNQNFTAHTISAVANGASSVFAADVDGDGDTDVLSASFWDDRIVWYKNDGSQNFTTHTISTAADGALSVCAADVDGDGDIDVLSASELDDKIAWYENDGSQNFTTHTISTAAIDTRSVFAADVDGDGDTDILSASFDKIAWYENDSSQNFTAHTISTAVSWAQSVFAADVDGDGDIDILSASYFDDKIDWYENDAGQNFIAHTISTAANGARSVFAADMDGDGDTDVLSASNGDDKIAWYTNDGSQNFTTYTISNAANGAISVFAADVDGDGDLDVLSASLTDDKIAWYENRELHFGVSAPTDVTAGASFDITVTALNENNQLAVDYLGTVHFTSSDPQAILPTDYTFTVADQGVHTFTVTLKTSGSQSMTVTDTADATITGDTAVQVDAAAAATFELTATVTSITKGKPFNVTLTAYDPFQNVAIGYSGTVHFTSSDTLALLPSDYAFVSGDQGAHTFSVKLKKLGNQSVTVTDTANGLLSDSLTMLVRADKAPLTQNPTPPPTPLPLPIPAPPAPSRKHQSSALRRKVNGRLFGLLTREQKQSLHLPPRPRPTRSPNRAFAGPASML